MSFASRLALFSEKFIQACWLIALLVAPVFFNIYSSRVFEPDKITLIRTLALAMGAMWLVLRAERWRRSVSNRGSALSIGERARDWLAHLRAENPLTLPALVLLLAYIISTLLSLSPTVSFFGSYQRLQGLYTFASYLVIFLVAASLIRSREDIERAITVGILASFPIAFYGIIQHYFVDPLPWVGDVTSRVASNLGNSIFIGAFLILCIPLALYRLVQASGRAAQDLSPVGRIGLFVAVTLTPFVVFAAWGLAFDLTAKPLIEANYTGTLTPPQFALASGAFSLALALSLAVVALWGVVAFFLQKRVVNHLLIVLYSTVLGVQLIALVFSQSRGPLLGVLGGLFTFGVLYALVRGARKLALGAVGAASLVLLLLALINIPNTPLTPLRELPYVGRLGRVFELEGGTGRVRVLIWQGALKLVVPHEPLWSPLTGDDPFNVIRPIVGYGPETMYVAYNKFYPPELGTLESRNATPDRSHNETFDALVTTGLAGFIAENVLFLSLFYLAFQWLGLMTTRRARLAFIAAWYGGGVLAALLLGAAFGLEFIGVALPGGMVLSMFIYLVAIALRRPTASALPAWVSLVLVALVSLFVSHFIEIHFGIAIVSTRVYFWLFAAVFVVIGTKYRTPEATGTATAEPLEAQEPRAVKPVGETTARRKRTGGQGPTQNAPRKEQPRAGVNGRMRRISTAPLITYAFLVGFILAVMGYDYINTNNLGASGGQAISGLDVVISSLTLKNTTGGAMTSPAMLWLFVTTLFLGLGICVGEWGHTLRISIRDWGVAILLFFVLAFAIFSGLVFYHVLLVSASSATILSSLLAAVVLFTLFMLIVAAVIAFSLMFDEVMPSTWVNRTTNWVVAPVLAVVAAVLILATNVDPIRADMLYKQAVSLTGQNNTASIQLFENALDLQPQQDYYYLFLGRAYLDAAKQAKDAGEQGRTLQQADDTLHRARAINPYNTDHSANLARLAQARGALGTDSAAQIATYKQAAEYFDQANRLSPYTAHLYDQAAQALLEYSRVLEQAGDAGGAAQQHQFAWDKINSAINVDKTFCLTYAVRAQLQDNWRARVSDSLSALAFAPICGDVFHSEGLSLAVNELAQAADEALAAKEGDAFDQQLSAAARSDPSLELFTTLANFYSKAGRITDAIRAVDEALAHIPASDTATTKRYQDFRFTLVELQNALEAAKASPNDPELQRAVAGQWMVRGQFDFALPAFQEVIRMNPGDYDAQRNIVLLEIATDQIAQASKDLAAAQTLAPATDQTFWQKLDTVLQGISSDNDTAAVSALDELARGANTNDYALVSALRKLAEKMKGAG